MKWVIGYIFHGLWILYEDDNKIIYNKYTQRLIDDQEIYMTENGENLDVE